MIKDLRKDGNGSVLSRVVLGKRVVFNYIKKISIKALCRIGFKAHATLIAKLFLFEDCYVIISFAKNIMLITSRPEFKSEVREF